MSTSLKTQPKESSAGRKEKLLASLKKKKECEARAQSIVYKLVETSEPVDPNWLLDIAKYISQSHYQDATEERALVSVCGYPLCQNKLENIPKQKYRISLAAKKVYDLQDRKNFCSNKCYAASTFLKKQLLTSPLWLRTPEEIPQFQLQDYELVRGLVGEDVLTLAIAKPDNEDSASMDETKTDHGKNESLLQLETRLSEFKLQTSTAKHLKRSDPIKSKARDDSSSDIVLNCLQQWTTKDTLRFIYGDEKVNLESVQLQEKDILNDPRYKSLCKRLDIQDLQESVHDENLKVPEENSVLKPLPSYEQLKQEFSKTDIRVKAFYGGQSVSDVSDKDGKAGTPAEDNEVVVLPLVDSHAQKLLRRRIVSDQLERIIPDLARTLNLPYLQFRQDVKNLVATFSFTADNITFKPDGWSLVGLLIIKLISLKNLAVKQGLQHPEAEKFTQLMLLGIGAPRNYLDNFGLWVENDALHALTNE